MEVVTCKSCGRLFNHIGGPRVCPNCQRKLEEKFVEVKKYVREHPHIDMAELSEAMEVSVRQIKQWVREERLVFSDDSPVGLPCESCGTMIKTGRFCAKCKNEMTSGLLHAAGMDKKKDDSPLKKRGSSESRMRFLDN